MFTKFAANLLQTMTIKKEKLINAYENHISGEKQDDKNGF
jgi:hypothetical protein